MNKRVKIILIIASILILLGITNAFAVGGDFSINKTSATIEIGKTATFSITATNCGGKFTIASSNTSVATVSSNGEWVENASAEITITAKAAGTAEITITASDVATSDADSVEVTGSKTITITVPEEKNETNTNTGNSGSTSTTTPAETPTKSSEARLKTFGITPYDFSGFSKNRDKEKWSVTVPNSATEVTVYGTALGENATVKGTGKIELKEGTNEVKVTVTAEAGNTKTYILTITRRTAAEEATENSEAGLKMLGIKPEEYDFTGFKSETTEYSVEVPNEIEQIEIYATAINSKAQITGTGMVDIKEGENELPVEVIAVDGTKKTYTLKVTRKEAEQTEDEENEEVVPTTDGLGLSTLTVTGLIISPKFKTNIYEYKIDLRDDLTLLDIKAKANDSNATVEIIGNENLQQGENIITILLKNEETEEAATYQIIVNKNVVVEEKISWLQPSTWGKEEKIKIAIVIVLIILIIIAIVLKIKISNEEQDEDRLNLPGADELDKAITEHQELSEDLYNEEAYTEEVNVTADVNNSMNYREENVNYIEEIARNKFAENNEANDNFKEETVSKLKRKGRHF